MTLKNAFENLAVESKQDDLIAKNEAIRALVALLGTEATLVLVKDALTAINTAQLADGHAVSVNNHPTDFPDSAVAALLTAINAAQLADGHAVSVNNHPADFPDSAVAALLTAINAAQLADGHAVTVDNQITQPLTDAQLRASAPNVLSIGGTLVPDEYDEAVLSYTGDDLTGVVYKLATATVATLTLSYTTGKLTGVVRS